jgi:hypothetical protein
MQEPLPALPEDHKLIGIKVPRAVIL